MAQTFLKKKTTSASANVKKNSSAPSRGAKKIAPKKASCIKQQQIQKKLTAGINRSIEEVMAVRAGSTGKLTIMKKLAKESEEKVTEKDKKHRRHR